MSISKQALARKQRFNDEKDKKGGAEGIAEHFKNLKWNLWFNHDGDIMALSKEDNSAMSAKFKKAEFTNEQIGILTDKNWSQFRITVDKIHDTVAFISPRQVEDEIITKEKFFLNKIEFSKDRKYDFKVKVTSSTLEITAHKSVIDLFDGVDTEQISINGKRMITLYFTTNNDPSFLYHQVDVHLSDVIKNKTYKVDMPKDLQAYSVYTMKLFDKYVRANNDNR